jgi:dTDP-4-amino-4,6-dideoxygalactose transaminase
MAFDVGRDDEVITTPYSFFATVSSITRLGAVPIFVDIDPKTYNLNVEQIEAKITDKTKAIQPVHLYGQCAEMEKLREISRKYNIPLVEDAAQAIGAEDGGKRAGAMSEIGCFSFYPSKNLGGMGDGGFMTTDDDRLAENFSLCAFTARASVIITNGSDLIRGSTVFKARFCASNCRISIRGQKNAKPTPIITGNFSPMPV